MHDTKRIPSVGDKTRTGCETHEKALAAKRQCEAKFPGTRFSIGKDDRGHYIKRVK